MTTDMGVGEPQSDAGLTDESSARRESRDSMFLQATIRRVGAGDSHAIRVRNLSAGGLMADCAERFVVGEEVELDLRRVGIQTGRIAWVEGQRIGLSFARPINPVLARTPVGPVKAAPKPASTTDASTLRRPGFKIL